MDTADSKPFKNKPDGTMMRTGFMMDISHQQELEQKVSKTSNRLKQIINTILGGVYQARVQPNGDQTIIFASRKVWSNVGLPEDSSPAQDQAKLFEGIHPDDRAAHREAVVKSLQDMKPRCSLFRFRRFDNQKLVYIEVHTRPFRLNKSPEVLFTGISIDVTDRINADQTNQ